MDKEMEEKASLDMILIHAGDRHLYQKALIFGFIVPLWLLLPSIVLAPVFLVTAPDHWCHVPGKRDDVSLHQWKNWTIPWEETEEGGGFSLCEQYNVSTMDYPSPSRQKKIIACQNGWEYDKTWYDETLSSKGNWVCQQRHLSVHWISFGMIGKLLGVMLSNRMSDIVGRKKMMIFLILVYVIFSLLRLVASGNWMYPVMTFSMMAFPSLLQISIVFVAEQVANTWRSFVNFVGFIFWMVGMCLLSLLAWVTRSWVWLTVATSAPFSIILIVLLMAEESPRWLITRGRTKDAYMALERIARYNGKKMPDDLPDMIEKYNMDKLSEKKQNLLDFLKTRSLLKLVFLLEGCWICNMLIYYSLNYNVNNLGGNQFINFALLGLGEGPSTILAWATCQTIGRRLSQILFFAMVVMSTACPLFFSSTKGIETVVCAMVGKIMINSSFYAFYLQMIEIFPTSHRPSLMGMLCTITLLANISSPIIADSSAYWSRMPYVIMLALSCAGCVMSFFLPETLDNSLPQTISDSEKYYSKQSLWTYKGRGPKQWPKQVLPFCYPDNVTQS